MRLRAAAACLACALAAAPAGAQIAWSDFHLGRWEGGLQAGFEAGRQETRSPDGSQTDFALRRFDEKVSIGNTGMYFIDPRLFSADAVLTLGWLQDRESSAGVSRATRSELLGYALDAALLGAKPYGGALFANRHQSFLTQPFGRTDVTFENRGATFRLREDSIVRAWGIPYLSANVHVEQQRIEEATESVLGQSFHRDESRTMFGFDGHDGLPTADLDWSYEYTDLRDRLFPQDNFHSHSANLNYSQDFGPALNRRWDSRLSYYRRDGVAPYDIVTATEQVRVDHDTSLTSGYRYLLSRAASLSGLTTLQSAGADVRHQLYQNLGYGADATASHETLPAGTRDFVSGRTDVRYTHRLPLDGRLFSHASARAQLNDNRLSSSTVSVIDEAHAAPTPLGAGAGFFLNQPFATISTIVVVDTRGGARLPTVEGVDYELVEEGNRTRIDPLLTSAVIRAGDPLAVSYDYRTAPSIRYATYSGVVGGGVSFGWIDGSVAHEQSSQRLIAGEDNGFLESVRKDTVQLDLQGAWKSLQGQASAAYVRYDATRLAYTQQRYYESVVYRHAANVSFGLAADWTRTDFTLPVRHTDARSARGTIDWFAAGWSTTAMLARRVYKDDTQQTETITEATVRTRFEYGRLTIASDAAAGERVRGGFRTRNWSAGVHFTRKF